MKMKGKAPNTTEKCKGEGGGRKREVGCSKLPLMDKLLLLSSFYIVFHYYRVLFKRREISSPLLDTSLNILQATRTNYPSAFQFYM